MTATVKHKMLAFMTSAAGILRSGSLTGDINCIKKKANMSKFARARRSVSVYDLTKYFLGVTVAMELTRFHVMNWGYNRSEIVAKRCNASNGVCDGIEICGRNFNSLSIKTVLELCMQLCVYAVTYLVQLTVPLSTNLKPLTQINGGLISIYICAQFLHWVKLYCVPRYLCTYVANRRIRWLILTFFRAVIMQNHYTYTRFLPQMVYINTYK